MERAVDFFFFHVSIGLRKLVILAICDIKTDIESGRWQQMFTHWLSDQIIEQGGNRAIGVGPKDSIEGYGHFGGRCRALALYV